MRLEELNLNLIPRIGATGADALAQPTFGVLDVGITPGQQASISLTADSTSAVVGTTFTVEVEIKTNAFTINEYDLVIDFDPTQLSVIDAKPTEPGTQIEFLDTVFQVDGTNNNVSSTGRIILTAKTPSGNALQVNRKIARITFQSQKIGNATITPASGTAGSRLINQNGVAIASTLNSITINMGTTQVSTTSSVAGGTTTGNTSTSQVTSSATGVIPDTGIVEDISANIPLFGGLLLVIIGILLRQSRPRDPHEKK